jgi:diguanylate cyclase (GGDEF)-like protein
MTNSAVGQLDVTGLPGREALLKSLEQQTVAAHQAGTSLAVMVFDVDHFKDIDRSNGHGDEVLKHLAQVLRDAMPAGASLAHLDGDEFVASLPATNMSEAAALGETLRQTVEAAFAKSAEPLTVTIGVAVSPTGSNWNALSLLSLADSRMTFAKKRLNPNRNIVWAGALPSDWYVRLNVDAATWPSQP